ncbi:MULTISPECIES: TerC family protein [Pseudomonas]|uniref:YjbE family putative metal transport protein n=1 Tax=Pseudomonas gingeri TaxID=117681 RepID=A0A7Y7WYQ7_9PSED|nr:MULTISPECIES: YjbE family putative metal transport protein [Pseudomonas]MPQ65131.1 YjbE family putative metal transport protein [Pseudomonas sp. MWU12-2323]NWB88768.1 YjbE family putative metal transport protein [Pseudomonas gingeri]
MIGLDTGMQGINLTLQVFLLDLLLSGDNAVVIALACRHLPARQMRQALFAGMGVAVGLRILFTSVISLLLKVPCLKLAGMVALVVIAIKLLVGEEDAEHLPQRSGSTLWSVVGLIVFADLTMSLDNVVALAAVAQDNIGILVLGLLLSIPMLMYGSLFVTGLFKRYPWLIPAGGALLGWVAGDIGMSDPLIADWVATQAPGLVLAMPLACAIFVLVESRIIQRNLRLLPRPEPVLRHARMDEPVLAEPMVASVVRVVEAQEDISGGREPLSAELLPPETVLPVDNSPVEPVPDELSRKRRWYWVGALAAVPLLGYIGYSVIYVGIIKSGYMPTPRLLSSYECPGLNGPFVFFYQHGKDTVRIHSSAGSLDGALIKGRLEWINSTRASSMLGFTPPQEITNDDATSIRINGGSFSQMVCFKKD